MIHWSMSGRRSAFDEHAAMGQQEEMDTEFLAEKDVSPELASRLMKLAPTNPMCTKSFADAMRAYGHTPWLLGIKRGGGLVAGCYGFLFAGRLNRVLQIPSLPGLPGDNIFWDGLLRFCSLHRITCLELQSLASSATTIPRLRGEVERQQRCEYVLDVADPEWERKVARRHRETIRMAVRAGVASRRTTDPDSCREHVRLLAATHERQRKRGESISCNLKQELLYATSLLETGGGELFQAMVGATAVSSYLLLRAAKGACGITAGTSSQGMKCGASHFLIYSTARVLQEESMQVFNLGSAELNTGLRAYP